MMNTKGDGTARDATTLGPQADDQGAAKQSMDALTTSIEDTRKRAADRLASFATQPNVTKRGGIVAVRVAPSVTRAVSVPNIILGAGQPRYSNSVSVAPQTKALLIAAAMGAALMGLVALLRRP